MLHVSPQWLGTAIVGIVFGVVVLPAIGVAFLPYGLFAMAFLLYVAYRQLMAENAFIKEYYEKERKKRRR
jgi:urea transporter